MVAKAPDRFGLAELAPLVLKPLRKMRNVSTFEMATRMGLSERGYRDLENGTTNLLLERIFEIAEILKLDAPSIVGAFLLRRPEIAHDFAYNKLMLAQASAIAELNDETRTAVAAVDTLTALDAHVQFYKQLAEYGRAQLRAAEGKPEDPP